jgi:hypothetical protein
MPQDVTDGLKRSSVLQEMEGGRVAQAMWALVGNAEPAFTNQRLKGFRDGIGFSTRPWERAFAGKLSDTVRAVASVSDASPARTGPHW